MKAIKYQHILVAICFCSTVTAYSAGAPDAVCSDMKPQHPGKTDRDDIPYVIEVNDQSVKGGDRVKVTVKSDKGQTFKGMLVQARVGDKIVGSFDVSPDHRYIKAINCAGNSNAVTHKNKDDKKSMTFDWIAPKDLKGKVQFFMTIVQEADIFWVKKPSATVTVN